MDYVYKQVCEIELLSLNLQDIVDLLLSINGISTEGWKTFSERIGVEVLAIFGEGEEEEDEKSNWFLDLTDSPEILKVSLSLGEKLSSSLVVSSIVARFLATDLAPDFAADLFLLRALTPEPAGATPEASGTSQ